MRSGGCALQQALTAEAAGVVKQAVVLAKSRGHAQVTPLHVANTMLAGGGVFRVACQQSNSHPLQCKALKLCFDVALNRLPASSSNPMLSGGGPHSPSISNALVAAFKRAQAHQRRGTIESQQQQPGLVAVKIELEQLIISILDDPSVSRVMREAGFSSTQVKTNVEKAVSLELSPSLLCNNHNKKAQVTDPDPEPIRNEDVKMILETLSMRRKRKSVVLVGESISNLESTVKGLMSRVDKGGVPDSIIKEVKFITIPPLYSFCNLRRDEVDQKIGELTCLVKSLLGKGVILYLGDLKWISDYRVSLEQERRYYCSVDHMIIELGRLVWGIGEIERFWLMGIATFQTYMRCRSGHQSLETVWGLHPVTIPANSLGFSLVSECDEQIDQVGQRRENRSSSHEQEATINGEVKPSCCADCLAKLEDEARNLETSYKPNEPALSSLPSWLKDESRRLGNNDQCYDAIRELHKKWNTFCSSTHTPISLLAKTLTSSFDDHRSPDPTRTHFLLPESTWKENGDYWTNKVWSNPSTAPNSGSSSDIIDIEFNNTQKFKEFNSENLNILCNALEKNVPSHKEIVPEIVGTVLQCRSGMLRRKDQRRVDVPEVKEETWLLFLGPDESQAKEKISRELARVVFGSYSSFVSIGLSSFVSLDDCRHKRGRDERGCMERFAQAVSENPHRVFFVEDFEQADYYSKMGIKRAIGRGRLTGEGGEEVGFCDAIVVLSCERSGSGSSSSSRAGSPSTKDRTSHFVSLDLNLSFDDDDEACEDEAVDDVGILEKVDRRVVFKNQDL